MNMTQAKSELIGDIEKTDGTLDSTADALIARIGQFFGECVGGDTFCGLSIDETRDENGLLTSLKLVPCDLVNGDPQQCLDLGKTLKSRGIPERRRVKRSSPFSINPKFKRARTEH